MDIDYSCGHKFQRRLGNLPERCPKCSRGVPIGAKGKFYMSDEMSRKIRDALQSKSAPVSKATYKSYALGRPQVGDRCLARRVHEWRSGTVIWHREGNDVDALVLEDDGATTFWAYAFRPARTQEQKEREGLTNTIKEAARLGLNEQGISNMVWAAGWRKADDQ